MFVSNGCYIAGFVLDLISIILIIILIAMPIISKFQFYDMDPTQVKNWTWRGRSRPSWARMRAMSSGRA